MTELDHPLVRYLAVPGILHYPTHCVVGVVPEDRASALIATAIAEGLRQEAITVILANRRDDFELKLTGGGLRGFIERVISSTGGDLDLITDWYQALEPGNVLVAIKVGTDEPLRHRIAGCMRQHDGRWINFLTQRSIETMDYEAG